MSKQLGVSVGSQLRKKKTIDNENFICFESSAVINNNTTINNNKLNHNIVETHSRYVIMTAMW